MPYVFFFFSEDLILHDSNWRNVSEVKQKDFLNFTYIASPQMTVFSHSLKDPCKFERQWHLEVNIPVVAEIRGEFDPWSAFLPLCWHLCWSWGCWQPCHCGGPLSRGIRQVPAGTQLLSPSAWRPGAGRGLGLLGLSGSLLRAKWSWLWDSPSFLVSLIHKICNTQVALQRLVGVFFH